MTTKAAAIGEEFDPFGAHLEDPYELLARARDVAPVFFCERLSGWVVTRYEDVLAILRDPTTFSSRNTIAESYEPCEEAQRVYRLGFPAVPHEINTDRPEHTRFRRALQPVFNPRSFSAMKQMVRRIATGLADRFETSATRDILSEYARPLSFSVVLTIFGVSAEDHGLLGDWFRQMLATSGPATPAEDQVRSAEATVAAQHYFADLIEVRRREPSDDMVSNLVHHEPVSDAPFTMAELVEMCRGLVIAGHETTASLISNATVLLLEDPTRWRAVESDRGLLPTALEEVLRFESPLPFFRRLSMTDVVVADVTIPANATVFLALGSANRDARRFPEPGTFDLRRTNNPHVAFGSGLHFCLGAPLARMEARIALDLLLDRYPGLTLGHQRRARVPGFVRRWNHVRVDR